MGGGAAGAELAVVDGVAGLVVGVATAACAASGLCVGEAGEPGVDVCLAERDRGGEVGVELEEADALVVVDVPVFEVEGDGAGGEAGVGGGVDPGGEAGRPVGGGGGGHAGGAAACAEAGEGVFAADGDAAAAAGDAVAAAGAAAAEDAVGAVGACFVGWAAVAFGVGAVVAEAVGELGVGGAVVVGLDGGEVGEFGGFAEVGVDAVELAERVGVAVGGLVGGAVEFAAGAELLRRVEELRRVR